MKHLKSYFYLTCFITGFSILLIELIALRIFIPLFGQSNYVQGIIINSILIAMATGYYLGGHISQKTKSPNLVYYLILLSAIYLSVIHKTYISILRILSGWDLISGSILSVFLMFFIPILILAFIPTYLIRIIKKKDDNKTPGVIFALSTLGSIMGGIFTTFLFIPFFGSNTSFLISIWLLLITVIIGLIGNRYSILAVVLLILTFTPTVQSNEYYFDESEYNLINVLPFGDDYVLKLNDNIGHDAKSIDPITYLTKTNYDYMMFSHLLYNSKESKNTLILGNGPGTMMMTTGHYFDTNIDGVEIDSKLTEIGKKYFGLKLDNTKKIYHDDARHFLVSNDKKYDIIYLDVYKGSFIPFHVATKEFFQEVKNHIGPEGIVVINYAYYFNDGELKEKYLNTVSSVFSESYTHGNIIFCFSNTPNFDIKINDPVLKELFEGYSEKLTKINHDPLKSIFTDDKSDIDILLFGLQKEIFYN